MIQRCEVVSDWRRGVRVYMHEEQQKNMKDKREKGGSGGGEDKVV